MACASRSISNVQLSSATLPSSPGRNVKQRVQNIKIAKTLLIEITLVHQACTQCPWDVEYIATCAHSYSQNHRAKNRTFIAAALQTKRRELHYYKLSHLFVRVFAHLIDHYDLALLFFNSF